MIKKYLFVLFVYNVFIIHVCFNLGKYDTFKGFLFAELYAIPFYLLCFIVVRSARKKKSVGLQSSVIFRNTKVKWILFVFVGLSAFFVEYILKRKE